MQLHALTATLSFWGHGVLLALAVVALVTWVGASVPRRRSALFGVLLAAAWTAFSWWSTHDAIAAPDVFTQLQEGNGLQRAYVLHGRGAHAHDPFFRLADRFVDGPPNWRAYVRMNRWLAGVNACAMFAIAWWRLGNVVLGLGFALLFAGNRNALDSATSELPSQLIFVYVLIGALAAALLDSRRLRARRLAIVMLAILIPLAAGVRTEVGAAAAIALIVAAVRVVQGDAWIAGLWDRSLARLRRLWRFPWYVTIAVLVAVSWLWAVLPVADHWLWVVDALYPFNPSFLHLYVFAATVLPIGVVLLCVAGTVGALRRLHVWLGLPVIVLVLWRLYYSAGHGYRFELIRYLTIVLPALLLLALGGWTELQRWLTYRRVPALVRRHAGAGVIVLCLLPPIGVAADRDIAAIGPLSRTQRDTQLEFVYLRRLVADNPTCAFVAPVDIGHPTRRAYALFGGSLAYPRDFAHVPDELTATVLHYAPTADCVLLVLGLDCHIVGRPGCSDDAALGPLLERHDVARPPYNHDHYGERLKNPGFSVHRLVGTTPFRGVGDLRVLR